MWLGLGSGMQPVLLDPLGMGIVMVMGQSRQGQPDWLHGDQGGERERGGEMAKGERAEDEDAWAKSWAAQGGGMQRAGVIAAC